MIDLSSLTTIATAALVAPLLSGLATVAARAILLSRAPKEERLRLKEIEETLREVAVLREKVGVSREQMEQLLVKVVEASLTESRGLRLLGKLEDVEVQGGRGAKEALLKSAERALHERFAGGVSHPAQSH